MTKFALILLAALGAVAAVAPAASAQERARYAPGEVIVRYAAAADAAERRAIRDERRLEVEEALSLPRTQVLDLPAGASVSGTVASLEREPGVVYAEPNYRFELKRVPNDRLWADPGLWGLRQIRAPDAWDHVTGSAGVTVAVIDSGIDPEHTDLASRLWTNAGEIAGNGTDDDRNGRVDDVQGWDFVEGDNDPRDGDGHGSHVAGTIGARGNDLEGVPGVNWDVRLMSLRVCGSGCLLSDIADAITYAAGEGARVANLSLGGPATSQTLDTAISAASTLLLVAAAGNENANNQTTPSYPCNAPGANVVCVAAGDQNDNPASFTNWGSTSVDLAAPGTGILSTFPFSERFFHDFSGAGATSGWDLSAPWAPEDDGFGDPVLSDSPGGLYANNADVVARRLAVATTGLRECSLAYDISPVLAAGDVLRVEIQRGTGAWTQIASWTGGNGDWDAGWHDLPADADNQAQLGVRFRLTTDGATRADGVWLDNVALSCRTAGDRWAPLNGTSMATPHVAGAAALLLARRPGATVAQLRDALLQSGDVLPATWASTKPIATNRRLNVFRALLRVDPPDTQVTGGPAGPHASTGATFTFGAAAGAMTATTFECSLDGAAFAACPSPREYTGLAQGSHTFRVRARDTDGNLDPTPATRTFTVDTVAPTTQITSGPPASGSSTTASFTFAASEAGSTFVCSLDGGAAAACPASHSVTVSEGDHTLSVGARDAAGNLDATPAVHSWTVTAATTGPTPTDPAPTDPTPTDPAPGDTPPGDGGGGTKTDTTAGTGGQQQPTTQASSQPQGLPLPRPLPLPIPAPTADTPAGAAAALVATLRTRGLAALRRSVARPYRSARPGTMSMRLLAGRRVVAQGSARYTAAGLRTVTVRPTRAGRALLRNRRRLALTVRVTFTPSSGRALTASRRVTATARARR